MKISLGFGILLLFSTCLFSAEEFHCKRNVAYTLEYLVSENKTETYDNMFFTSDDWILEIGLESNTENSSNRSLKSDSRKFRKMCEFLQVHPDGKREQHLLDAGRIVRITNLTLSATKAPATSLESSPPKNESLDIAFTK